MITVEKTLWELTRSMLEAHTAVNPHGNPVALRAESFGALEFRHIIGQYSLFPRCIVSFLYAARETSREAGWGEVAVELTRNIGEELGTESGGISHYEMLLEGIAQNADPALYDTFKSLESSVATRSFLARVEQAVNSKDVAYVAGAVYALESSAVPELIIVRDLLERFLKLAAHRPVDGTLKAFFDMHVGTWEPGHEQGLHSTIPAYIQDQELPIFSEGFEEVMNAMDMWWQELCEEAGALEAHR